MGSRLMHYALGRVLADRLSVGDKNAFVIGSILPDALPAKEKKERNSHFIELFDDGRYKWFNSLAFFGRYSSEVLADPIYLGYYFHLIADNIFRRTFYIDMGLISRRGEKSLFEEFYRDYNILNPLITEDFGLTKTLTVPERLKDTRLYRDFAFSPEKLIEDIYADMDMHAEGELTHFNMEIVRGFVEKSTDVCMREFSAMAEGRHVYDKYQMAIENRYSGKREKT